MRCNTTPAATARMNVNQGNTANNLTAKHETSTHAPKRDHCAKNQKSKRTKVYISICMCKIEQVCKTLNNGLWDTQAMEIDSDLC